MTSNPAPSWWHFKDSAWHEIVDAFAELKNVSQSELSNNHNWLAAGGLTNDSYQLTLQDNEKYFVQIVDPENLSKLPLTEFTPVQRVLKTHQTLQSWLVDCLYESKQARIFNWIDAEETDAGYFNSADFIDELAEFLATLHSGFDTLPMLDIQSHLENYYQIALNKVPGKKVDLDEILSQALVNATSFSPTKSCHNDLSPGNILYSDRLYIVDWEYCCISDPVFELAGIAINFQLSESCEANLIKAYCEKSGMVFVESKYEQMKVLYQCVCQLWAIEP